MGSSVGDCWSGEGVEGLLRLNADVVAGLRLGVCLSVWGDSLTDRIGGRSMEKWGLIDYGVGGG